MSDELNKTPENGEQPETEEAYEGILGDYKEDAPAEAAETASDGEAPAEEAPREKKSGKKALAIAGVCAAVLAVGGLGTFGVLKYRETMPAIAASSTHGKVTDRMAACYIRDMLDMYISYYGEEGLMSYYSLDINQPLKGQTYALDDSKTWFDVIIEGVENNAKQYLVFREAGQALGYKLTDSDRELIEKKLAEADYSKYAAGVTEADLRAALELQAYGAGVYNQVYDSFEFTDEEIEAYMETSGSNYITCGLMGFSISYETEDETADDTDSAADSETASETETESDTADTTSADTTGDESSAADEDAAAEEEEKGLDKATAEKLANKLKSANTADKFESQVKDIMINYEGYTEADLEDLLPTISNDNFSYMTGNELGDWAFGGTAKVGDTLVVEGDGVYYVYLMTREPSRDDSPTINVRHILFSLEDHINIAGDTATDEENEAALEECRRLAQEALDEWNSGDKTEDSFAALANKLSEDPGSNTNGGIYENVYQGQMVQPFNDWCFDESRKVGDTGLVETSYGVHVMFFSGVGDPLWKSETVASMRSEKFNEWYSEQEALYEITVNDDIFRAIEG